MLFSVSTVISASAIGLLAQNPWAGLPKYFFRIHSEKWYSFVKGQRRQLLLSFPPRQCTSLNSDQQGENEEIGNLDKEPTRRGYFTVGKNRGTRKVGMCEPLLCR